MKSFSIQEINDILKGVLTGNTTHLITGPEQLETANNNQITFIGSKKYVRLWESSKACAAIISDNLDLEPGINRALIKVKNADLAMAQLLEHFIPDPPHFDSEIHPAAVIHPSAVIGKNSRIGAGCFVGMNVKIGNNVTLYPNVTIMDERF